MIGQDTAGVRVLVSVIGLRYVDTINDRPASFDVL